MKIHKKSRASRFPFGRHLSDSLKSIVKSTSKIYYWVKKNLQKTSISKPNNIPNEINLQKLELFY